MLSPCEKRFSTTQGEGVVERVPGRLAEGSDAGVLRVRPQQLSVLHRGEPQARRRIGDDAEERIGHQVRGVGNQAVARRRVEDRRVQLVVLHRAFSIRQVVALAAEISGFDDPAARQFALKVGVPLLDDGVHIVAEEALADAKSEVRVRVPLGGAFRRSKRQVVAVRDRDCSGWPGMFVLSVETVMGVEP